MIATADKFYVVCECYTRGPFKTREAAERVLDGIVATDACHLPHRIESDDDPDWHIGASTYT